MGPNEEFRKNGKAVSLKKQNKQTKKRIHIILSRTVVRIYVRKKTCVQLVPNCTMLTENLGTFMPRQSFCFPRNITSKNANNKQEFAVSHTWISTWNFVKVQKSSVYVIHQTLVPGFDQAVLSEMSKAKINMRPGS